ncbi:MAG: UDP-N-acetylmuramoyl-L-alanyl-D-glutamate--2,6-diaminopimelate ligase [Gammaproteobacteria bacterium RIFCSPHIGHO2_12_FULL_42_13]|nr:MAG: UDP-N-acetylmuramoyl-L-alanyl-D-glutamate--2,6-diaminopimelate ligase [Gammaproteobacteria bacterium RIFCSPHIGHO2_12_FULL_42_13]
MTIRLSVLLQDILTIPAEIDRDIAGISLDSRLVKSGYLFIASQGHTLDGRQYITQAFANGACAVIQDAESTQDDNPIPVIAIPQLQGKLTQIAAKFFHYPAKSLRIIGVTGTNGKTSCSHFIASVLQKLHIPCGIIGTIGIGFHNQLQPALLTTPDVVSLQNYFREFVNKGAKAIAMEVSSHGIAQGRVKDIDFDIGIFTNLTRDHLDYHGSMEAYAAVKQSFLTNPATHRVVINADDALGMHCIELLAGEKPVFAYSLKKPVAPTVPYLYTDGIVFNDGGIQAIVYSPWGMGKLTLPLIGEFNLSNALAVLAALCMCDIPFATALEQLSTLQSVAGRMQLLGGGLKPTVVVDYSHTPDALEKVLATLRAHCQGRLFCLFGCGGDRDRGKRPQMARVAEQWADRIVVTNDNPRHEKPEDILADILPGFNCPERVQVQLDRSKAIQDIIESAASGDWVLIAGKGAELYQQVGDVKTHFSDAEQVARWL